MLRKKKPAAFEESLVNDDAREEEEARAQEFELLRIKHQLEIDECRIKQQREELTLRMRHAHISSEYLPTTTQVLVNMYVKTIQRLIILVLQ